MPKYRAPKGMGLARSMVGASLAGLILCASQPAQAQAKPPRRINPEEWMVDAPFWVDAHAEPLRVRLHVWIDKTGHVGRCSVTLSSGIERLDQAACFLVQLNARYEPAVDISGNAIASEDEFGSKFMPSAPIETNYPAGPFRRSEQGNVRTRLDFGIDGRVKQCSIVKSSGYKELDDAACRSFTLIRREFPPKDVAGQSIPFSLERNLNWVLPR